MVVWLWIALWLFLRIWVPQPKVVNCNDLTRPPKWWFMWGIAPQPPYFRLVKYHSSPRKAPRDRSRSGSTAAGSSSSTPRTTVWCRWSRAAEWRRSCRASSTSFKAGERCGARPGGPWIYVCFCLVSEGCLERGSISRSPCAILPFLFWLGGFPY